jgi:phosphate starvation-inducible PhoH-like protein
MNIFKLTYLLFYTPNFFIREFSSKTKIFNKNSKYLIEKNITLNNSIESNEENEFFKKSKKQKSEYNAKTINQNNYKKSLYNSNINLLFSIGPAGTGKTLFACQYAIKSLQNKEINKIIITRPTVAIEEDMGFLPGDINAKMHPFTIPIFDIFEEFYSKKDINEMLKDNIIEIAPLGFMQGRSLKNSVIVADEMQNSTPSQMFMLLTRLGMNSKMILTGDLMQTNNKNNGLNDILYKLSNYYLSSKEMNNDGIDIINFTNEDIQRSSIVKTVTEIYFNKEN